MRALEALVSLGPVTMAARDLGGYLARVAEAACTALDFGVCLIYLRDPSDNSYHVRTTRGVGDDERGVKLAATVPALVLGALTTREHQLAHGFGYYVRGDDHVWRTPLVSRCFAMAASPRVHQCSWLQGDLFLIPLPDGDGPPSGFLVLDEPLDGLRPSDDTLLGAMTLAKGCADALLYGEMQSRSTRNEHLYNKEHDAVQHLQTLDDLRNDFVSTISHELRTPLTGIKGYTDSLIMHWDRMDDDRRRAAVTKISFSTERLNRLVQDLLFISRIESGTLPLERTIAALDEPIASAVHAVAQSFAGQRIEVRPPREAAQVLADMDRVEQVVTNLLDNGAKYSVEGKPVRVSWARRGSRVLILVTDRGPGISTEDQKKLFARFGKLGHAPRAGHVGTGLGLYISRNLVEAMGGRLRVRSLPGQGSVFAVTLPAASDTSRAWREG